VVARTPAEIQTNRTGLHLGANRLANGNVLLRQSGTPGADYHVQVTTNFVDWREVGVATGEFQRILRVSGYQLPWYLAEVLPMLEISLRGEQRR